MDIFIANSVDKNYEKFGEEIFYLEGEMAIFAKSRLRLKSYHPLRANDPYQTLLYSPKVIQDTT